ncbi:uncharacterized protein LOC124829521 isoform X2 [Vigna umbellata]|uniref:uncharacterized protein LOC108318890 isoform X2 n=1 Tax=Phaseolus angularis TaxID=3914 RepID=UPI00080A216F|nr:uncharacterized protein LOC108318890 isoform X2 [Vigna angularis]XP_047159001.1 uncharacterized protein LOC124829521 isoform X2 [Vigna umbellata]
MPQMLTQRDQLSYPCLPPLPSSPPTTSLLPFKSLPVFSLLVPSPSSYFAPSAAELNVSNKPSSGVKSLKEEALDSLKALGSASVDAKGPPSPVQTLLGGVSAGVIALILYKFASTIEGTLNRQTISDNYSVRQITITVRTIVNGLTYLATFVFGLNSLGLFLYSGQLAIKSIMGGDSTEKETESKSTEQSNSSKLSVENPTDNTELSGRKEEQSSNDAQ